MKIKRTIEISEQILNQDNNRTIVFCFLEKYIQCEILCKNVVILFLNNIGEDYDKDDIPFTLNAIKKAISSYNIIFNDNKLLTRIWGQNEKKGNRSLRKLRNKFIHELNENYLLEIIDRYEDLTSDMNIFIEKFKNFNV